MSKREYTHVRLLYPEIKAMIEAGKTQREIAEYYGFKDKYVVKGLLKRERRRNAEGIPKVYLKTKKMTDISQTQAGFKAF